MRIVGGFAKGRPLKSPRGRTVRPTPNKVKAAFFNIIGDYIIDAKFLDLFSGIGNVGIEALSRGAGRAVFVEKNYNALHLLRQNIWPDMQEFAVVLPYDLSHALKILKKNKEKFNIIYIDPPYKFRKIAEILFMLFTENLVESGGIIAVERGSRTGEEDVWPDDLPFRVWKIKVYGDTLLLLFKNEDL